LTLLGKLKQDFYAVPFMPVAIRFPDQPMLFEKKPSSIFFRLRADGSTGSKGAVFG